MALDIDLQDPGVHRLLGADPPGLATGKQKELVQIAGDAPNPTGQGPRGAQTTYRLNQSAFAHPRIWYKDHYITADAYRIPGEPLRIHILCPRCSTAQVPHGLMIPADKKHIVLDLDRPPPENLIARIMVSEGDALRMGMTPEVATLRERAAARAAGLLNIEPIECTWELPGTGAHTAGIIGSGASLCRWKVVIENNVARDV